MSDVGRDRKGRLRWLETKNDLPKVKTGWGGNALIITIALILGYVVAQSFGTLLGVLLIVVILYKGLQKK